MQGEEGGWFNPSSMNKACIPLIFIKTSQFSFQFFVWWKLFDVRKFKKLSMIKIDHRGCWKRSFIFQALHPSQKLWSNKKKKSIYQIFLYQKILRNIEETDQFSVTCTFDFSATQRLCFESKSIDQGVKS